ncbi:hypothetical protein E4K10_30730 [Streptomyces sp. T1317-0309]|nr:hypothetical protein E4K10_30730 [Streptomyces sp. T1317-0309]
MAVQAHRVEVAAGGAWSAGGLTLLQSVTFTAFGGTATITTADGTSTLHDGESVTWSVAKPDDAALVGPLEVAVAAGGTGTVAVAYTRAVNV